MPRAPTLPPARRSSRSEHSNEYGINLSGPLVPFGAWKEKIFYFGNYNGFRYTSATPTSMTFPTTAQQNGDFSATGVHIYDPLTQAACTANSTDGPCRYRYGYGPGVGKASQGNPVATGAKLDAIPASEFSAVAVNMQKFLPQISNAAAVQGNYIAPNATGLVNWSMTHRLDYNINTADTLSMVAAIGRQASSNPVGQNTSGRNVGPVPYNYGQAYAPKTAVGVLEETHVFSPHLVNQIKWGYARYNGPTFNSNQEPNYAATTMGLSGPADWAGTRDLPDRDLCRHGCSHKLGRHHCQRHPSRKTTQSSTTCSGRSASTPSPSAARPHGCFTT